MTYLTHLYMIRSIEYRSLMFIKYTVKECIRRLNLLHLTSARNDNSPRSENAHRNAFALSISFPCALSLTWYRTLADACTWIRRIVEELGIYSLVNGLFQHAKQVVFINQYFV